MTHRRTTRRNHLVGVFACAMALAASPGLLRAGFCDLVFKDVSRQAAIVALVEYQQPKGVEPHVRIVEVLKGSSDRQLLRLGSRGLKLFKPKHGDRFLLAMTPDHTLVKLVRGMGMCSPISVLPIHGEKLRGRDRTGYDGAAEPLDLDEIRADLAGASPN